MASVISYGAVIIKKRVGWDDALDVWACHGVGGVVGSILLGVFAQKEVHGISGLIEGDCKQFGVQIAGAAIVATWSFVVTVILLLAINVVIKIRVPEEVERVGLDLVTTADHGAYDVDRERYDLNVAAGQGENLEFEFQEDRSSAVSYLPNMSMAGVPQAPSAEEAHEAYPGPGPGQVEMAPMATAQPTQHKSHKHHHHQSKT